MKWKEYHTLRTKYPFIARDLDWEGKLHALRDTRKFVRVKVGYICFRPFEVLDLSAPLSITPCLSDYVYTEIKRYCAVEYKITFHVEGEREGERRYYVANGDSSIRDCIGDIAKRLGCSKVFCGKQLIWERVTKRTMRWDHNTGLTSMSLEIFQFPRFYRFKPIQSS